jgi:hypothetical protein
MLHVYQKTVRVNESGLRSMCLPLNIGIIGISAPGVTKLHIWNEKCSCMGHNPRKRVL